MVGITVLITLTAALFCVFLQVNKGGPFRDINPFGEDPYDAVGSFAVQVACLVGALTYARALRLRDDRSQVAKARLILRGNGVVLAAILVTLSADTIAVVAHPLPPSWGTVLLAELALMAALAMTCVVVLAFGVRRARPAPPPRDLTPADAIDDLWTLLRGSVDRCRTVLPARFVEWTGRFNSDRLFARVRWLDPRSHPWRFACALGPLVGIGLLLVQLQEGFPPSLESALLVMAIVLAAEFAATLLGFAVVGGYLGLRPSFGRGGRP